MDRYVRSLVLRMGALLIHGLCRVCHRCWRAAPGPGGLGVLTAAHVGDKTCAKWKPRGRGTRANGRGRGRGVGGVDDGGGRDEDDGGAGVAAADDASEAGPDAPPGGEPAAEVEENRTELRRHRAAQAALGARGEEVGVQIRDAGGEDPQGDPQAAAWQVVQTGKRRADTAPDGRGRPTQRVETAGAPQLGAQMLPPPAYAPPPHVMQQHLQLQQGQEALAWQNSYAPLAAASSMPFMRPPPPPPPEGPPPHAQRPIPPRSDGRAQEPPQQRQERDDRSRSREPPRQQVRQ